MGLRGYSSSAESQAGYNVRSLIVDRGFAEGGEVVWIDGSDFELELESVKAQARSPVAAPNKLEKGWFSRQGLSVCILPALLQTPNGTFNNACTWMADIAPIGQQCLRAVPSMHVPRRHPNKFSSSNCSRNRTMAREAC
jgi:hypothetical protein